MLFITQLLRQLTLSRKRIKEIAADQFYPSSSRFQG